MLRNVAIVITICLIALSPIVWHYSRDILPESSGDDGVTEPCAAQLFAPHTQSLCELLDAVGDQKKTARRLAANQYDLFNAVGLSALILTTTATLLLGFSAGVWQTAGRICTALAAIGTGVIGVWNLPNWINVNGKLQFELAALESELEIAVQLAKESNLPTIKLNGQSLDTEVFILAGHKQLSLLLANANTDPWVSPNANN